MSCHYVVFESGRIVQCVPEDLRAWHAGVSSWAGESDINSCSIGIEVVNPGHEFGYRDFPLRQIAAVIMLCKSIVTRRGPINADRVLAHSDVAPGRKQDPGEKFPWELLSESGIGHWVRPAPLDLDGPKLKPGDSGNAVSRLQRALRRYGYGIEETGSYDEATQAVVTAFQRHFRPARVDGIADASTLLTLRALIETRPAPLSSSLATAAIGAPARQPPGRVAETLDEKFDEHRDARQPLAPGRIDRRQRERLDVMAVGQQRDQLPVAQRAADDHVGQADDAGAFDRQPQARPPRRRWKRAAAPRSPRRRCGVLNGQRSRPRPATIMQS